MEVNTINNLQRIADSMKRILQIDKPAATERKHHRCRTSVKDSVIYHHRVKQAKKVKLFSLDICMSEKNYAGLKSNYDLQFHPKSQLRHNCVTNESQFNFAIELQLGCN